MFKRIVKSFVALSIFVSLIISSGPTSAAAAPTCYASSCNYVDPNPLVGGVRRPTTCWNDAYNAVAAKTATGASGKVISYNKYSPGCVANFSYTKNFNGNYRYLAAETYNFVTYDSDKKYVYVWNVMIDGTLYVCTRGKQGTTQMVYDAITGWMCA